VTWVVRSAPGERYAADDDDPLPAPAAGVERIDLLAVMSGGMNPPGVAVAFGPAVGTRDADPGVVTVRHRAPCHPPRINDLLAVPFVMGWQITLFMLPMLRLLFLFRNWERRAPSRAGKKPITSLKKN
jgi:hypothetical protein